MKPTFKKSILSCALIAVFTGKALAAEQSIVNTTKSNTKDLVKDAAQTETDPASTDAQQRINKSKSNVKNNKLAPEVQPGTGEAGAEPVNSAVKPNASEKGINQSDIK